MSSGNLQAERPYCTFHKYFDSIFIVAKKEIYRVYVWLYQGGAQYVGDYLMTTPRGMRKMKSMEKEALRRRDNPVFFDIPFIYNLMQHVCGLAEDTSSIWYNPSTPEEMDSLEYALYRLKELRNAISHRPDMLVHLTQEDLDLKLNEVKDLCTHIISKAGERTHRYPDEVSTCIYRVEENLKLISNNPAPSGLNAEKFAVIGRQEMVDHHCLSLSRSNFVMPLIHSKGETARYEMNLRLFPLWRCEDGSLPKVILLHGDTGTGKTSICRYLYDSWLSNNEDINELQDFDLVFHVPCCEISTTDLVEFVGRCFFAHTMKLCNREEIPVFLQTLRILWLVDGYEDATEVAFQVLIKVIEQGNSSHLVFITTKPPHCQELLERLKIKENLCLVRLSGLSEEGIVSFLMKIFQEENENLIDCQTKQKAFCSTVASLGNGPLTDLSIPLKLKLMVELWKRGKLKTASTASLTHLYEAILEVQVERLIAKMQKETKHKRSEIIRRIQDWTKVLSKIAFQMIMNGRYVKIDDGNQEELKREAERLHYPEDCLAIFLHPDDNVNNSKTRPTSYLFFHGSHQIYLAARHILTLLLNSKDPTKILKRHFKWPIVRHIYPLLIQVLSGIPKDPSLEQSAAGYLVKLLSGCIEFDAFQVVKDADYSPKVVEEVSKHVGRYSWNVTDLNIEAAYSLLAYVTPMEIDIKVILADTIEELYMLLESVSQKEISLKLDLPHGISTNISYSRCLIPICSHSAKCHLSYFSGILKDSEVNLIEHMSMVANLHLDVMSNDILDRILDKLKYMTNFEVLSFHFNMPVVMVTQYMVIPDMCKLLVALDETNVLHMRETGQSLSRISKSYHILSLFDMSANAASELVEVLEKENVRVNEYRRHIRDGDGEFVINFGSLPLTQSVAQFKKKWQETYVETYEDQLGMKRLRLLTHKDVSSKEVRYVDISPEFRFRVRSF